jgi:hypothetical protein
MTGYEGVQTLQDSRLLQRHSLAMVMVLIQNYKSKIIRHSKLFACLASHSIKLMSAEAYQNPLLMQGERCGAPHALSRNACVKEAI